MSDEIFVRPAVENDADAIYALTGPFVESRQLLARSPSEIRALIPGGFVAIQRETNGHETVVGFSSVEIYSRKLGEILCLAVDQRCQGKGVGRQLVNACVNYAKEKEVTELMAISASDPFLKRCGFDYTLPDQKRALFIHPHDH